ncbi:MAG: glycoside hydrolase family 55 protein, partial [Planctomycetes bacterium]|nr:glycoside hydrolase family 55 protein [Planctomycetota bacterium]
MLPLARTIPLVLALLATCGGGGTGGKGKDPGGGGDPPDTLLESTLYPADWTPAFTDAAGRYLHDFSYAGYRNGEAVLPDLPGATVFDAVAAHGADPTGATDSTAAIQKAIDAAGSAGGGVVFLPAGLYRVDGILTVEAPGVVLRGQGPERSRLAFTKSEGMSNRSHLTFRGKTSVAAEVPLVADAGSRETAVLVEDASPLAPGDDVDLGFTITPEFVAEHGMTGVWTVFLNTWQPFFRRTVVSVDTSATPHRVTL